MTTESEFVTKLAEDLPPDDVRHVLHVFRDEIGLLCRHLETASLEGDLALFRRTAHSIAGAAGAVGAGELEQAARQAMKANSMTAVEMGEEAARLSLLADDVGRRLLVFLAGMTPER